MESISFQQLKIVEDILMRDAIDYFLENLYKIVPFEE